MASRNSKNLSQCNRGCSWGVHLVLERLYSKGQNEYVQLDKKRTELDSLCLFWLSNKMTSGREQNKDILLGKKRTELDSF